MWLVDRLAEECIERARARGDLDDLPNAGQPLDLADDAMVPPALRPAYRLLRNAGYVPEEIGLRREIRAAEDLLRAARCAEERAEASARLRLLLDRLGRERAGALLTQEAYHERLRNRLAGAGEGREKRRG